MFYFTLSIYKVSSFITYKCVSSPVQPEQKSRIVRTLPKISAFVGLIRFLNDLKRNNSDQLKSSDGKIHGLLWAVDQTVLEFSFFTQT